MEPIYKIEVNLYPSNEINKINKDKPFFWNLRSYVGNDWCLSASGWAKTPEEAWIEAYNFYNKYKK